MLRWLKFSITCICLGLPTASQSLGFEAFSCQPTAGSAFIVYVKFTENGGSWWVGGHEAAARWAIYNQGNEQVTLTEADSSTMLVLDFEDDRFLFRGLFEGEVLSGECIEATQEFLAAVQFASPSMHKELDSMRSEISELIEELTQTKELLRMETDAKRASDFEIQKLKQQLSVQVTRNQACEADLSDALITVSEAEEVKQLKYYLENWKNKVGQANGQISQLCNTLATLGYETVQNSVPITNCKQVR